jgi:DNA-binding IclR family transcriptional regulator
VPVTLTLTDAQVHEIARGAVLEGALGAFFVEPDDSARLRKAIEASYEDERFSRSTLRALAVLTDFPLDGSGRELTDVANRVGLSVSTTYRYISTWVLVGALEQDPTTRKYMRTRPAAADEQHGR